MKNVFAKKKLPFIAVVAALFLALLLALLVPQGMASFAQAAEGLSDIGSTEISITGVNGTLSGSITIPNNINGRTVTQIEHSAFLCQTMCNEIVIPSSVTSIASGAFAGCSGLTAINVSSSNLAFSSLDGVLFNKNQTTLIRYPGGKTGNSYTVPNTVTAIGVSAFSGNALCGTVVLPSSVTHVGGSAFLETNINYKDLLFTTDITGSTITGTKYILTGILHIPSGVTAISDFAFANQYYDEITIAESVASIGENAFRNDVRVIWYGNFIFEGYELISFIGSQTSYTIPDFITSIGTYSFSNSTCYEIIIPDSVVEIGQYAFRWSNLRALKNLNTTPQVIDNTVFENKFNIELTVPIGTIQDYINAGWTGFRMFKGEGTENAPYLIGSAEQLILFASEINSGNYGYMYKCFALDCDINLNDMDWIPVGSNINCFRGTFDGQGYVVSNYVITGSKVDVGFFGVVTGSICNLGVENFVINTTDTSNTGGLIGYLYGGSKISNCYASGDITVELIVSLGAGSLNVGGLIGYIFHDGNSFSLTNSYAIGNIDATATVGSAKVVVCTGGLIGNIFYAGNTINIANCYATVDIVGTAASSSSHISGNSELYAGGFIGFTQNKTNSLIIILYSFATGSISGTAIGRSVKASVGGFNGDSSRTSFNNCYCYDGQGFYVKQNNYVSNMPTSFYMGNPVSILQLDSPTWYTGSLYWSTVVWDLSFLDFANVCYPVLI